MVFANKCVYPFSWHLMQQWHDYDPVLRWKQHQNFCSLFHTSHASHNKILLVEIPFFAEPPYDHPHRKEMLLLHFFWERSRNDEGRLHPLLRNLLPRYTV